MPTGSYPQGFQAPGQVWSSRPSLAVTGITFLTVLYPISATTLPACGEIGSGSRARRRCWNIRLKARGMLPPRHRRAGQSLPTAGYRRYYWINSELVIGPVCQGRYDI